MISDTERREIAARLRDCGKMFGAGDFFDAIAFTLQGIMHIDNCATTPTDLLHQVADLIDRPTCKNESGYKNIFLCSERGARLEITAEEGNEYGDIFNTPLRPRFCSACGAEVVE